MVAAAKEVASLSKHDWEYLVLDEAQRIKNTECVLRFCLQKIHSRRRLLLTGTPIQNNIDELFSLLNFIMPKLFKDAKVFRESINVESNKELAQKRIR